MRLFQAKDGTEKYHVMGSRMLSKSRHKGVAPIHFVFFCDQLLPAILEDKAVSSPDMPSVNEKSVAH